VYPRALLRQGSRAWAAIAAPPGSPDGALSFGLIWLDYVRRRDARVAVEGLVLFLPVGGERNTCLRLQHLDPAAAQFDMFIYGEDGTEERVNPLDYSNIDTSLPPCCHPIACAPESIVNWTNAMGTLPGVERRMRGDGCLSLAVRGMEFARVSQAGEIVFGINQISQGSELNLAEIESLAAEVARLRVHDARDRRNPLWTDRPEAWLESQVRSSLEEIDATLLTEPTYGQVPEITACERSILDLLAVDRSGRLAVIEIKASEDIHLPLQALDYWIRVKWHLDRNEFSRQGYFPSVTLRHEAPRLLLLAPAVQFHPTNETILRFLRREIAVERIGVGIEWRKEVKVVFRIGSQVCRQSSSATSTRL
jgi:hypothetical protein